MRAHWPRLLIQLDHAFPKLCFAMWPIDDDDEDENEVDDEASKYQDKVANDKDDLRPK